VQATGIPVALDETLSRHCEEAFEPTRQSRTPEGVTTLALKPFMMPDLKTIFYWIDLANERGLDLVISSCFESVLGISWLVMLAGIANPKLLPAGLSTYSWFEENFFTPDFSVSSAMAQIRTFQTYISSNRQNKNPRIAPGVL
jgi:O-succinylbenzoate synthase